MDSGRTKRKASYARVKKEKVPDHLLSESEIESIKQLIALSTSEVGNKEELGSSRSEQIYDRIEELVTKGTKVRRDMGASFSDQGWFEPERQKEIKQSILDRCMGAMKTGMRYVNEQLGILVTSKMLHLSDLLSFSYLIIKTASKISLKK